MLQPLLNTTTSPLLKQVARFAERRQEVLAGNIANIDTPGYRMRDLPVAEFQKALAQAVAQQHPAPSSPGLSPLTLESPGSPPSPISMIEELFPETLFQAREPRSQPGITFQDANNRSMESQFLQMTQNQLLQQFAAEVLRQQYDQLQMAISERVG
ncbi:MAG TPA: flagellar basal body protein [Planctomycetaceae bacterium]|nr:flagellar basal body protein [Planctomycetaceae bacterium]